MTEEMIRVYDEIVTYGIATEEEINLCLNMNGVSMGVLNMIINIRTGYRDIDQFISAEIEDNEE